MSSPIFPMKINLTFPPGIPDPLPPAHPYWTPTDAFCERHKLHIDEAEVWVELSDTGDYMTYGKTIRFSKDTGETIVSTYTNSHIRGLSPYKKVLFIGFLPNEAALEDILTWTNWNA